MTESGRERRHSGASEARRVLAGEGAWLLVVGVALIAFANCPPLPMRGAQLSDLVAGCGALLVIASALVTRGLAGALALVSRPGAIAALA